MNTRTIITPAMPKPHADRGIEGRMASWYASTTAKSMAQFEELAQRVASELPEGGSVLEVAPGPGYFCIALAKRSGYQVTGLDLSPDMVRIAREKAVDAGVAIDFQQGNSSSMPFPENSFDFLVCRAAFKNFAHPQRALAEMHRVLRPGGRGLIIDLRRDAQPAEIYQAVDGMGLTLMNRVITKLTFRFFLLKSAYAKEHLEQMLAQTSFSKTAIVDNSIGFEIWLTK
jgi:ubiquinone/menaquinone biosynthesis C-methylase UbiE